jgi:hypothetical protein
MEFVTNPYILATDNIDYLPLARYAPAPSFSVVFNYNSVDFGTVTPNTIAEAKSINYNVSIASDSDYKVSVNATDWSGATTIPANTLYFAVNDTLDKLSFSTAKQLSNAVQQGCYISIKRYYKLSRILFCSSCSSNWDLYCYNNYNI